MTQPLVCHFLIGLPGSGKSTFAVKLQGILSDAVIVSSDTSRKKLYGDKSIQGDWINEVKPEVLTQIKDAISLNKPVIYDLNVFYPQGFLTLKTNAIAIFEPFYAIIII